MTFKLHGDSINKSIPYAIKYSHEISVTNLPRYYQLVTGMTRPYKPVCIHSVRQLAVEYTLIIVLGGKGHVTSVSVSLTCIM